MIFVRPSVLLSVSALPEAAQGNFDTSTSTPVSLASLSGDPAPCDFRVGKYDCRNGPWVVVGSWLRLSLRPQPWLHTSPCGQAWVPRRRLPRRKSPDRPFFSWVSVSIKPFPSTPTRVFSRPRPSVYGTLPTGDQNLFNIFPRSFFHRLQTKPELRYLTHLKKLILSQALWSGISHQASF